MTENTTEEPQELVIDRNRCEAYGFCTEAAPNLLALDDDAVLHTLTDGVPADELANAQAAVRVCPVAALKLQARALREDRPVAS